MLVEAWLTRAARTRPHVTALETPAGARTYTQLHAIAQDGARTLRERGIAPGDRVAIALPPGLAFAQALHACLLQGAIAIPIDPRLSTREQDLIAHGAALVISGSLSDLGVLTEGAAGSGAKGARGQGPQAKRARASAPPEHHDLDAIAIVIHTSGTTSAPRPIELTYGNLLWSALGSAVALDLDPRERWLCALPLAHVGGLSILLRSAIYATTAIIHPRFETDRILYALAHEQVTLVSLVATTLARLLDAGLHNPTTGSAGGAPLRHALTGGGPIPQALLHRARAASVPITTTYGLTEACSQVSTSGAPLFCTRLRIDTPHGDGWKGEQLETKSPGAESLETERARVESPGMESPRVESPGMESPETERAGVESPRVESPGMESPETEGTRAGEGEILVAGPTVAPSSRDAHGWLRTGDLGALDAHGLLTVTGRVADTIVSGGENVAPAEVEAVLEAHPDVLEAAVLGRAHPEWGQAVAAIVVPRAGAVPDGESLRAHCAQHLARYKVPKQLDIATTPLPRTNSGKLLRRNLS